VLCLFLLEMAITACKRLPDLKSAGPGFIVFGISSPNLCACFRLWVTYMYSMFLGYVFPLPYCSLFAVLCATASCIAVPAAQRGYWRQSYETVILGIPEYLGGTSAVRFVTVDP